MASCVNKVFLIGRLGRDPEIRSTSSGQDVANFTIATDESYIATSGEKIEKTEWHKVVAWGATAEIIEKYVTKGLQIGIEGKLSHRTYDDKNGEKRFITEVVVNEVLLLGK